MEDDYEEDSTYENVDGYGERYVHDDPDGCGLPTPFSI